MMTTPLKGMIFAVSTRSSQVQHEVDVMKNKHTKHTVDPLMMLALLVTLGVMMISTVSAEETFLRNPEITDLEDGDIILVRSAHGGAGIHMSFMSQSELSANSRTGHVLASQALTMPDLYLTLRLPW
jgi:hypothetical protein